MFSEELSNLLFQVIKSWQVIAVSIAVILYISLVNYAARAHKKPAFVSKIKPKKKEKKEKPKKEKPASKNAEGEEEIHEQE
jgi:hypothetical protein